MSGIMEPASWYSIRADGRGRQIATMSYMAQVTIYLADEIEVKARKAAKVSLGRWIAEQIAGKVKNTWPPEMLAAVSAFPDFPETEQLRSGYGPDAPREPLD